MLKYETLILSVPEATTDEASKMESQVNKIIETNNGKLISFDRWGKYRLAYPVKKNKYGVYFLTRFEIPKENNFTVDKSLKDLFSLKLTNLVMRFITTALDKNASLEYKVPTPLDEQPKNVDEFLKENKMGGLLKESTSSDSSTIEDKAKEEESIEASKDESTDESVN